jgi:hypothetical protein
MTSHPNYCCQCQSTVFLRIPSLPVDSGDGPDVLHLVEKSGWFRTTRYGQIRALVCAGCGRTELYADGVEQLRKLASDDRTGIAIVDFSPGGGI